MCFKNSVFGSCLMLVVFACWFNAKSSDAFGTFGFDIHHRYSDTVKQFLNDNGLPEKGTVEYYSAVAHRDRHLKGRHLATSTPILTFYGANETQRLNILGYLHYSLVTVGTPALTFIMALDTGTDLFWLPCDCTTCARSFNTTRGEKIKLEIYSPSNSTTSTPLPCNSTMCGPTRGCSARFNACSYQQLRGNASSSGILVDDVLHLGTNTNPQDPYDVTITLGCGQNQTGSYLDRGGINGVFGLGMDSISVPNVLAKKGAIANSFSMCFRFDGQGRIEFGDKGSPLQKTTPFNLQQSHTNYNISVTQVVVGNNVSNLGFTAIFDTGTTFTQLNDPTYSFIIQSFNSQVTHPRYQHQPKVYFDYCYLLSANQDSYITPNLTFTMKGGSQFNVTAPTVRLIRPGINAYCLAIQKSEDINVIGQNYMEGYRLVFDREEMVLGWKEANCDDSISSETLQPNSTRPRPSQPPPPPPPPTNGATRLSSMTTGIVAVILAVFSHNFIVLS
ncbi:hypothetical protein ABFX02_14G187500 [Erythranthe guttata]